MSAQGRGGGVGAVDIRGWRGGPVVQNRESPDFRSPEVGRYECYGFLLLLELCALIHLNI